MAKTILIIEDNKLHVKLFNELLQAHGFDTICSIDGKDALQLARRHSPDLIIMDIQLPGANGLEHTRALKENDDLKHIPIIAVTAFVMKGDKEKILEAGCDGYISKPISVSHFLSEVESFLTTVPFRLTDALMTGHPEVDAEHGLLARLLNEFSDFLKAGDDKGCAGKISEITDALKNHLDNEEKIMEDLGYENIEEHKDGHVAAIRKYEALIKDVERNGYVGNFINKLSYILVDDFIKADMEFGLHLKEIDYLGYAPS